MCTVQRALLLVLLGSGCGGGDSGTKPDADTDTDSDTDSDSDTRPCPELDTDCDLVTGDGCAEGLRCGYWWEAKGEGDAEVRCLEPGDVPMGGSCGVVAQRCGGFANDCEDNAECLEPRDGQGRECLRYCTGQGTCGDGSPCNTTIPWSELLVCVPGDECSPVTQEGCDEGEGCYMVSDGIDWVTQCVRFDPKPGSTGRTGAPCRLVENCAPGWQCVTWFGMGDPVCRPVCSMADGECPVATGDCTVVVDLPDWGVCLPPE